MRLNSAITPISELWVAGTIAAAATVTTAGVGAYNAHQANATSRANAATIAKANQPFQPGPMPAYVPLNIGQIENQAVNADTQGFKLSDTDYAARHPEMVQAEGLFANRTRQDQIGESELSPAIQSEFMRAGLSSSLGSMGDLANTNVLTPGSGGEAAMARNLGLSIMEFQDRNRANRERSLTVADQLFPRRQFGLTGSNVANLMATNNASQNNWNQANYASQVGIAGTNLGIAQNAAASQVQNNNAQAAASAQMWGSIAKGVSGLAGAYGQYRGETAGSGLMDNGFYKNPNSASAAYGQGALIQNYGNGNYGLGGYSA